MTNANRTVAPRSTPTITYRRFMITARGRPDKKQPSGGGSQAPAGGRAAGSRKPAGGGKIPPNPRNAGSG